MRSYRSIFVIVIAAVVVGVFATPTLAQGRPTNTQYPVSCVEGQAWCKATAAKLPNDRAWAQVGGKTCSSPFYCTTSGYRWTGRGWATATIRTSDRWFWHHQTSGGYSIMQTYDTRIWVAVDPADVILWLPIDQVKSSRFVKELCTESMPQTCYYQLRSHAATTNR